MSRNGQHDREDGDADLGPMPGAPRIPDFGRGSNAVRRDRPKRQIAVALGFNPGADAAPKVMATGQGGLAERLLELAFANDVKVREDADLAEILAAVEVGNVIPLEAFAAVAEIIAYLYQANAGDIGADGAGVRHPRGVSRAIVREGVAAAPNHGPPQRDPFQASVSGDDFAMAIPEDPEWDEVTRDGDPRRGGDT